MYLSTLLSHNDQRIHTHHQHPDGAGTHLKGIGFWAPETVDAFENIDGLVLSKEVLSFGTFGGLSFEEF